MPLINQHHIIDGIDTATVSIHEQKISHIQFADCPGRHEPDTAQIHFAEIFQWLNQSTYSGYIAAEYRPQAHSSHSFAWKDKYFAKHPQS